MIRQHLQYAQKLRDDCQLIEAKIESWKIVLRFYSALHLMTSYALMKNSKIIIKSHEDRLVLLKNFPECTEKKYQNDSIVSWYRFLKDLSENIRYVAIYQVTEKNLADSEKALHLLFSFAEGKVAESLKNTSR